MTTPLRYEYAVTENGRILEHREIEDPFITTTVVPSGWRVFWAILRKRYKIQVRVTAPIILINAVMGLDREELAAEQYRRALAGRNTTATDLTDQASA